ATSSNPCVCLPPPFPHILTVNMEHGTVEIKTRSTRGLDRHFSCQAGFEFFDHTGGACARRVRVYRISRSPDAPSARIVPDTIAPRPSGEGSRLFRDPHGRHILKPRLGLHIPLHLGTQG